MGRVRKALTRPRSEPLFLSNASPGELLQRPRLEHWGSEINGRERASCSAPKPVAQPMSPLFRRFMDTESADPRSWPYDNKSFSFLRLLARLGASLGAASHTCKTTATKLRRRTN